MNPPLPFVCVSGWGLCLLCRWRPSLHCTPTQWWRDARTGCCSGRWWTDVVCGLHCSYLECWMHNACGSLVHILQRAVWIKERTRGQQQSRRREGDEAYLVSVRTHFSGKTVEHIKVPFSIHTSSPCFPHRHTWALVWPIRTASLHSDRRRLGPGMSARWVHGAESGNLQTWLPLEGIREVECSQWVSRYNHTAVTKQNREWLDG